MDSALSEPTRAQNARVRRTHDTYVLDGVPLWELRCPARSTTSGPPQAELWGATPTTTSTMPAVKRSRPSEEDGIGHGRHHIASVMTQRNTPATEAAAPPSAGPAGRGVRISRSLRLGRLMVRYGTGR